MARNETQTQPGRNFTRRLFIAAGLILAAVAAFVLYAMKPQDGKDVAADAACPGARAKAAALRSLAHGEVAAFSVADQPRPLPALKFAGPEGVPAALADFKGRTVLLNLWATWCVPCRQEMPALDRLEGSLGAPDFTVVAVNIDTARLDRPKAFLKEIGVTNLGFYADSTADIFQTLKGAGDALGLPTTVLVDKNGCALGVMAGPAQWDSPDAIALLAAARG
ncbi:MAG: thiol:disulfide interchange protein TlpA [Methylocella sp.]